jgi:aryl-alcohol dehydrogenase-like predicted oxidoreductase
MLQRPSFHGVSVLTVNAARLTVETKLYPHGGNPLLPDSEPITHKPEDIRKHLDASLKALNTDKIEMFYLRKQECISCLTCAGATS